MSDHDEETAALETEWKAACEKLGTRLFGNGVLVIVPGLGLNGLDWAYDFRPNLLSAERWMELGRNALATNHCELNAADLSGKSIGEAFLEFVIRDPKVQAYGQWLCFECRPLAPLFVGQYLYLVSGGASYQMGHKWPALLRIDRLEGLFRYHYACMVTQERHSTASAMAKGPVYHAAKALADRNSMFFDLLRGRQSELVADGIYKATGQDSEVSEKQWSASGRWVDIESSNLINKANGTEDVLYERLLLRRRTTALVAAPPTQPTAPDLAKPAKVSRARRRRPVSDAVADLLRAEGLDCGPGNQTYRQIAARIAPRMPRPYTTETQIEALAKMVARYYAPEPGASTGNVVPLKSRPSAKNRKK